MAELKTLGDHPNDIMTLTCAQCGFVFSHDIANLILATGAHVTLHDIRMRTVCRGCGTRGNNTYEIIQ